LEGDVADVTEGFEGGGEVGRDVEAIGHGVGEMSGKGEGVVDQTEGLGGNKEKGGWS
jgi:hypothetical protein